MKFWSILTLLIFLNLTALPSIAALAGWKLPQTNITLNEEENHANTFTINEKTLPKTLDVSDFLKFFESDLEKNAFVVSDDWPHGSPSLSILSPPPEL